MNSSTSYLKMSMLYKSLTNKYMIMVKKKKKSYRQDYEKYDKIILLGSKCLEQLANREHKLV